MNAGRMGLVEAARKLEAHGRGPDTGLAHMSPDEMQFIDYVKGSTDINPATGLREYFSLGKLLKSVLRVGATVGGFALSGGNPAVAAAANAAATKLTGGSWKQSLKSGALTGLTAGIGNYATGPSLWSNEALKGAGGAAAGSMSVGSGAGLGGVAVPAGMSSVAAPAASSATTGLGALMSKVGGYPGIATGLAGIATRADGKEKSDPSVPPISTDTINLNMAPVQRTFMPYGGELTKYGQPGQPMGHSFFDEVNPKPRFLAAGGPVGYAHGGAGVMRAMARAGAVKGGGDGMADEIPAALSDGEHIIDAQTVALAGRGSSDAGHKVMEAIKTQIRREGGMKNPTKPRSKRQSSVNSLVKRAMRGR